MAAAALDLQFRHKTRLATLSSAQYARGMRTPISECDFAELARVYFTYA
jgi:hypothetical protein